MNGPWKIEVKRQEHYCSKTGKRLPDSVSIFIRDKAGRFVAILSDEYKEHAALFAAVPELLNGLKHILEMRGMVGAHQCPGWDCSICTQEWGIAEAAIAKAEKSPVVEEAAT